MLWLANRLYWVTYILRFNHMTSYSQKNNKEACTAWANVVRMNFESLKAWLNCSRRLFKSAFIAWKDLSAILPTRFSKSLIFIISCHFDFCMQRQRFVIHSLRFLGFFLERSIISPWFYRTSPRTSEDVWWTYTLCRIGACSFRSYTLDFLQ